MVGMSLERWVIVCNPHEAMGMLTNKRRVVLHCVVTGLSVIFPGLILADLMYNGHSVTVTQNSDFI